MIDDRDIIQQVLDGEIDKFEMLIEKYRQKVFSIVGKRVPYQDHNEVAQDVFLNSFRSLSKFSLDRPFENWLSRIALRTCCDYWRAHAKDKQIASVTQEKYDIWFENAGNAKSLEEFEANANREETLELLEIVLQKLSHEDRVLVEMIYFEGETLKEAAEVLNWTLSKVKVRAMRARNKMRDYLGEIISK
jgi:RNA polymerase sigma-70 factor, ECF subfamily